MFTFKQFKNTCCNSSYGTKVWAYFSHFAVIMHTNLTSVDIKAFFPLHEIYVALRRL